MRTPLQLICFLLVVYSAHGFTNIFRGIWGSRKGRDLASTAENLPADANTEEPGSHQEVKIPERLFSKDLTQTKKSYCYEARLQFQDLCGLRSASERARLASLVTNCHLEVSGRPVFVWDEETKLADASEHYVYLVMQFIPLMTDVCEKAGYAPLLSQLVAETNREEDIRNKIDELQDVTERLFEANRQSSELVMEYINMSVDASRQLEQMLNLSLAIKEANDVINNHWEAIHQEANDIKAQLFAFTRNSVTLFDTMFGRFDGFQTQMASMSTAVGQIQSDSQATSMFLKDPIEAISNTSNFMTAQQTTSDEYLTTLSLGSFRKIGFVKNLIVGPIKLSEKLRHMERSRFFGTFAKDIFSSLQFLLVLMSIYIAYIVLTTLTKILETTLRFAAIFKPVQPIVAKVIRFFDKADGHQGAQESRTKENLSEDITRSISKAFAGSRLAEELAKLLRNDESDARFSELFTRISELDMRLSQISQDVRLLHQTVQSLDRPLTSKPGTTIFSRDMVGLRNGLAENPSSAISLVTMADTESTICDSNHKVFGNSSGRKPRKGKSHIDQNGVPAKGLNDSNSRVKDRVAQKENITTKPQVARRRSSRKRGNMDY